MTILRISLFGATKITLDGFETDVCLGPKDVTLLAYLLLHKPRQQSRDHLVEVLWPERSSKRKLKRPRHALTMALHRIRKALEANAQLSNTFLSNGPSGEIGFNRESPHWLDVAAFETQVNEIVTRQKPISTISENEVRLLEEALQLYHQGELLPGCYEDWVEEKRRHLERLYLDSLTYLMGYYYTQKAYKQSMDYGHRVLKVDPFREDIHRLVVTIYLELGQRAQAKNHFEDYCRIFEEENLPLAEESWQLYEERIGRNAPLTFRHQVRDEVIRRVGLALTRMEQTESQLEQQLKQIRWQLEETLQLMEQLRWN